MLNIKKYKIRVNTGDNDVTTQFWFVHSGYANISEEESDKAFDKAVKEFNHIYKDYGRFATQAGVTKLFEAFGFMRTTAD